ncbi:MAG: hypothetical protein JO255_13770, partial [Alphaproteobacteria bacterium]|nr:hypothetical protein [Alphaproteobacteria bacterium]
MTRDAESEGGDEKTPPAEPASLEQTLNDRGVRREDFCEEWIEALTGKAKRLGNYPMLTKEEREA